MTTWTSGYVADLTYTHGFYREMTPALLSFVALARGVAAPSPDEPLSYCELGCGQGFSLNLLAAANPSATFHATDFNPAQIAGAQALATAAGTSNVTFHDDPFATFGTEPDLPARFDAIALHGIWSWVSAENRRHIVDFVRDRLKPGGLLYVSYNALPGWASALPLRRLLVDHAGLTNGPIGPRIDAALQFASRVSGINAGYFAVNPQAKDRLEKMKPLQKNYIAHEYFNRDWMPFYHSDVAADMAEVRLTFVGSAHLPDGLDIINLTAEQQALLAEVPDPSMRETLRDYFFNQQFRRDVFVKGAVPLSFVEGRSRWMDMRFALSTARADVPLTVKGMLGEATLPAATYVPILDAFAAGPRTVRQLVAEPAIANLGWAQLTQALIVLVAFGHLQPALDARGDGKRAARTKTFNTAVLERARASADLQFLASPVTGGGIAVERVFQLFLLARQLKHADPAAFAWETLNMLGQRLIKDGRTLETADENLAELRARLAAFTEKQLPVLQQLGIA